MFSAKGRPPWVSIQSCMSEVVAVDEEATRASYQNTNAYVNIFLRRIISIYLPQGTVHGVRQTHQAFSNA